MIRLRAFQNPMSGFAYEFYLFDTDNNSVADDVIFKHRPAGEIVRPAFHLEKGACQELLDTLWMLGIRPSEGVASAGQLEEMKEHIESVRYHLEDMRKLVFNGKENL